MKSVALLTFLLLSWSPAFSQEQIDAATKEDVEQLLQVTGARSNVQLMWAGMAQEAATMASEAYRRKNPNATPLEIRKAAEAAGDLVQRITKTFSVEELIDVIIPIYQRHLTHSEIRSILDFYGSPVGHKLLQNTPVMMGESMQAVQPILEKHLPDLEAQAEAAAAQASTQGQTQPK